MKEFIYSLSCPITGDIRYIGKTSRPKERLWQHISAAKYSYSGNKELSNWIVLLISQNLKPVFTLIIECESNDVLSHEQFFINKYLPTGLLLNKSKLGDLHNEINYKELHFIAKSNKIRYKTIADHLNISRCQVAGYLIGEKGQISIEKARQLRDYLLNKK